MSKSNQTFVAQLFEAYHEDLHRYLVQRLRGHTLDAADVIQETYLRLLRMKDANVIEQPHAYLYRVATHVMREMGIKEKVQATLPDNLDHHEMSVATSAESPESRADTLARLQQLDQLIAKMPSNYRAVLILRKQHGMSHKEIARQLDISVHTVKKYLFRALSWCREHAEMTGRNES